MDEIIEKYFKHILHQYYMFDEESPLIMRTMVNPFTIELRDNLYWNSESLRIYSSKFSILYKDSPNLEKKIEKLYKQYMTLKKEMKKRKYLEKLASIEKDF